MASGTVKEVFQENDIVQVAANDKENLKRILSNLNGFIKMDEVNGIVELSYNAGNANLTEINKFCFDNGVTLSHLQLKKSNFESKFLALTN